MTAGAPLLRFKHSTILVLSVLFLAFCLWPARGAAQEVTATINGTITDPSGRVVSNAEVTATDLDRGTVFQTKTNPQGFYNLTRLPVGGYSVRVTAPGFRAAVETTPELELNQIAAVNIQLVVGKNNETVQVSSEAPLLQTESSEVSTVIDARANVDLPLQSRNYLQLTLLAPGVVSPNPLGQNSFVSGQTTGQNARPEINGNRFTAVDYVIDGMDNNEMGSNFIAYTPQPDAIQEFNLITQNAPADFGNYMGGVISVSTKAGTNKLHGSVFEFFRNNVLNANQWYNKLETPAIPRQAQRWNEFGAAVGGAIIKNKLFFFADYQGERFDFPTSGTPFTVFTAKERTGDFSELLTLPTPVIIKNPVTGVPYPGNIITSGLSPAALSIVNSPYYPAPINLNLQNNAIDYTRNYTNVDQGDGRLDWNIDDKNHAFGRFSKEQLVNPITNSDLLAYNSYSNAGVWNFVADYTRTLSTTLLNDARFGVSYITLNSGTQTNNVNVSTFGIPDLPSSILPDMSFSNNHLVNGPSGDPPFGNKNSLTIQADTVIQYQDVVNWTHGKHNSRFGFQGWRLRTNGFFAGNSGLAGNFDFDGQYSGEAESDFLLGLPDKVQVGQPGPVWGQRANIFSGFFQDDWKLTPKLVLNLGLRYENHTPWYESKNKQVNFDPITGNLELPGQDGNSRALYDSYNGLSNYQPRIGISYLLFPKTVIRAGYSMSEFMEGTGLSLRLPQNPPFTIQAQANYGSLDYPTTTLDQGFASVTSTNPCTIQELESSSPACFGTGPLLLSWDRHVQPARSNQWNLFVQQQLTNTMTFQVGYVGQETRHLTVPKQLNEYYVSPSGVSGPSLFFSQNQDLLNTYGALPLATYSSANSNYNALQSTLLGRLNHGLSYQLSYTWSHCLTNATGFFGEGGQSSSQDAWFQNVYDPKADYGSCYFNVKNVFSGYVIYELPFGHGRAYGSSLNSIANAVVGDWRVSAIPTFRGGFPLTLGANDPVGVNSFGERPNCNGPAVVYGKSMPLPASLGGGYQWFSPAPYSQPTVGYGTCSISTLYGPGEKDIDIGLAKLFPVREQQNLEFRTEFINAFNHTILNSPNTGLGSNLGQITGGNSSQGARNIQFALKYNF